MSDLGSFQCSHFSQTYLEYLRDPFGVNHHGSTRVVAPMGSNNGSGGNINGSRNNGRNGDGPSLVGSGGGKKGGNGGDMAAV